MARAAADDAEAFRLLVERWQQPVFAFFARMTGSREEALDLSQEVFLRVHRARSGYRAEGRFAGWLFRIAGNLARGSLRRRRILRWVRFDARHHDRATVQPPADLEHEGARLRERIDEALARLPGRQRQALLLRRQEGMSCEEIARTLGTSPAAAESLLQRAMNGLRRDLGPWVSGS